MLFPDNVSANAEITILDVNKLKIQQDAKIKRRKRKAEGSWRKLKQ